VRRWPGLSEKRDTRCHDVSDAFGPGAVAGCSDASGRIRRLRGGGTVEAGRAYVLLGRTSQLLCQLKRCAMHDSECQTKINAIFRRLKKRDRKRKRGAR
jgi:hypothetical protein